MRTQNAALLAVGLAIAAVASAVPLQRTADAEVAPSEGRVFAPRPVPDPKYDIAPPSATEQNITIAAADGTRLYLEWWLPTQLGSGPVPPARLPVIATLSPYLAQGVPGEADTMEMVVGQGYAYATFHVRGTGLSGGCQEQFSTNEVDDAARAIEWLGKEAPFSNGRIGTTGLSYPGITQVAVAGRGEREKVKYLKAIIAGGVATSQYDYNFFDGVPFTGQALAHSAFYNGANSVPSQGTPAAPAQRIGCIPEVLLGSADTSGDVTPFWADREHRVGASRTTAAVLIYHGHRDEIDREIALPGYVDRLPATTPRHLMLGTWAHAYPHNTRSQTPWNRGDWDAMKLAWFDRWVRGDTTAGVERWPTVQVQDNTGQWRAEQSWPTTTGPRRTLALSGDGVLGTTSPEGSMSFIEGASTEDPGNRTRLGAAGGQAIWTTGALGGPLHVTGQPMLDAWVELNQPDAHIAARLDAFDQTGAKVPYGTVMGFRSMQHLDPLVEGRFAQSAAKPAPVGTPISVQLRFDPTSFVVPKGGRLQLTLSGSLAPNGLSSSQPSGRMTTVTVLSDCERPSMLRFQGVPEAPDLLNVQEDDDDVPLQPQRVTRQRSDGGGIASAAVCGESIRQPTPAARPRARPTPPNPLPATGLPGWLALTAFVVASCSAALRRDRGAVR
ncbi:MAG TPA: CocE/NonD family hydrolase [Mycobacteriales bacterium]|nr:CocE/NonD family hydrolase [Mycobacteriales bacterium]